MLLNTHSMEGLMRVKLSRLKVLALAWCGCLESEISIPAVVQNYETDPGFGNLVIKVSDRGWYIMSSSPVLLKNRRLEEPCTLNLSRTQTSSRWCGVVVRRCGVPALVSPRHLTMV
ncbi:hypothetical protein TNCV_976691 [Trichonephila clavipes]|nr:hypothetical protein TNCV_976691 [Trichonephila clavipes]